MKKIVGLILLVGLMSSCDLFRSKDDLLTAERWIMYQKFILNKKEHKFVYYKRSEEAMVISFNQDGIVHITEEDGEKFGDYVWEWNNENKEAIRLFEGGKYGDFNIKEISSSKLELTKDFKDGKHVVYYMTTANSTEWMPDKKVETMNKYQMK